MIELDMSLDIEELLERIAIMLSDGATPKKIIYFKKSRKVFIFIER